MSSFCAYLTHRLHISDPVAWLMSAKPVLVGAEAEVERWTLTGTTQSYPLGANGFVFRKADLDRVHQEHQLFQDTHVALYLMRSGQREWLRISGRGVHHYYIQNLWAFLHKRRRAMVHYFNVQSRSETSWAARPAVPAWVAAIYCATLLGPLYHSLVGLIRDRDPCWLWHTPASIFSLVGILWGYQTYLTRRQDKRVIADLQPRQTLKKK